MTSERANESQTDNVKINFRKRKAALTEKEILEKRIRVVLPNIGSGTLQRSDFTSHDAWVVFLKHINYVNLQRKSSELLVQKCKRILKKVTDLKTLLKKLENKQSLTSRAVNCIKGAHHNCHEILEQYTMANEMKMKD